MKKLVKDLTNKEVETICDKYYEDCTKCPLLINVNKDKKYCISESDSVPFYLIEETYNSFNKEIEFEEK